MSWLSTIIFTNILFISIDLAISDVVLDLHWVLTVEGISLSVQVVQAASQTPNVHFVCQHVLLTMFQDFRCRVVEVATESFIFKQLFKVIWHSDQVELDCALEQVNSSWVNISEYEAALVDVMNSLAKLSKNGNRLFYGKWTFAKRFP